MHRIFETNLKYSNAFYTLKFYEKSSRIGGFLIRFTDQLIVAYNHVELHSADRYFCLHCQLTSVDIISVT